MKVILNKCYGGFQVSEEAYKLYARKKGFELYRYKDERFGNIYKKLKQKEEPYFIYYFTKDFGDEAEILDKEYEKYHLYLNEENRFDKTLIEVVEELGKKASGRLGNLKVYEIPDGSYFELNDYDGVETIYYSKSKINEI